jgi:IS5 family transposase
MNETTIQFPVTCPECGREALLTRPLAAVAAALASRSKTLPLYAPCHSRHWIAREEELQQIREYLGAWFIAAASELKYG